jgi:hypothetical protein
MTKILRSALSIIAALTLMAFAISAPAAAQGPPKVTIVVFGFPSLGAFMPPVIKAQKLDTAHGLEIEFVERPPDAYTTQFNSGEFKVGGSAAVLTVGLADARGVKVKYLFNLFDFWGTVVTSRPEIKSVKDLEGKQLAAASSTTNFVMFESTGRKHRPAGPRWLRAGGSRRRHPALGARLYAAEGEEALDQDARYPDNQDLDELRRWRAHPLSRRRRAQRLD